MSDTSTTSSFAASASRTQRAMAVDNFLRKSLRVNDPHDPSQIANALRMRYPEEADRERRELAGLPYSTLRDPGGALPLVSGLAHFELEAARSDFERDLSAIVTQSQLKDISVEMTGWGRAIRRAAADGLAAARLAIDSTNHDAALASRRLLCDYARLARYVGVLADNNGAYFRRLAQSCDVLGALILVGIGDGLAAGGVTRSASLVRVAAGELQARRSAVISALRVLNGSAETLLGPNDYPRGVVGYQALVRTIQASGQADLRALLEENTLAAAMDQLTDLTHGSSVANLRELSTTSALLVGRFDRLIRYAETAERPSGTGADPSGYGVAESPPLLAFAAALQLFVDAFTMSGGNRLLFLARPPILAYGLYDNAGSRPAQRLVALTTARGRLVQVIDCFASCGCAAEDMRSTVLFDFTIALIDRAIDLLAVGTDPDGLGEAERRAVAAGVVARYALEVSLNNLRSHTFRPPDPELIGSVNEIVQALVTPFATGTGGSLILDDVAARMVVRELLQAHDAEVGIEMLVRRLAPGCGASAVFNLSDGATPPVRLSLVRLFLRHVLGLFGYTGPFDAISTINLPQTSDRSGDMSVNGGGNVGHAMIGG
jgi:hypothetical protein